MCGRFALYASLSRLQDAFAITAQPQYQAHYNIAPICNILVVCHKPAECFLYAQQGAAFSGIVRTDIRLGRLRDDQHYLNLAPEVFSTIRSIHIQP